MSDLQTIYIGKGKKTIFFEPDETHKQEILKASLGRTGNLRAPALKVKNKMFVGFNDTLYSRI